METKKEISAYLENISLVLLAILIFAFPLVVSPLTTDPFTLPKQILLGVGSLLILIFYGVRMISDGSVRIRRTPFDIPIALFAVVALLSAFFAVNRADAFIAYVPLLFSIVIYFLIINFIKNRQSFFFITVALVAGAVLSAIITILSFFNIYILPFAFAKTAGFTPFGTVLDQLIYLVLVLPIAIYFAWPIFTSLPSMMSDSESAGTKKSEAMMEALGFTIASIIIIAGLGIIVYQVAFAKPPTTLLILPFEVGFQTAFAAVSQDVGRVGQGFFLGSGFGTYMTDFTRFKQAIPFNLNQTLWSLTFFRSSSFVLELLATTGVLGIAAFIFLLVRIIQRMKHKFTRENPIFFSLIFAIIASFILPFSPVIQTILFIIIGIFSVAEGLNPKAISQFFDIELHFVAFKKGIIPFMTSPIGPNINEEQPSNASVTRIEDKSFTVALPIAFLCIFILFAAFFGYEIYQYVASDMLFQDSLVAAAQNDGLRTYNDETNAINTFPYRDAYYRIYSQTNLALANNLASQLPKNASPSGQSQQTIVKLIQQSINTARNATIISPLTSLNWQNLSSIYRSLIGFGQGAESYAIASEQQAIALDTNNPSQYLNLGGIYYQLGQWDLAQQEFQRAINLKPDFANAYYNLGHTLESKGDYQNAITYYQTVKTLVGNSPADLKKIDDEISALQTKVNTQAKANQAQPQATATENQPPLNINTPPAQLPERKPQVSIPAPATPSAR